MRKLFLTKPHAAVSLAFMPLALLAACSSQTPDDADPAVEDETSTAAPAPPMASDPTAPAPADETVQPANILTLKGLGDLRIGEAVPEGSSWAEKGAQVSESCRVLTSPDYPGAYAIVEEDRVRRISLGQRSTVKLAEGIATGDSEAAVKKHFPYPETPHKYVDAPAKYMTSPDADSGRPALRIEIGREGNVSQIHVGTMPVLGYVEACS